jgi:hypothetical protein
MDVCGLADVLFSISALAESKGLADLHNRIIDAAVVAILEIPEASRNEQIRSLAGVTHISHQGSRSLLGGAAT